MVILKQNNYVTQNLANCFVITEIRVFINFAKIHFLIGLLKKKGKLKYNNAPLS